MIRPALADLSRLRRLSREKQLKHEKSSSEVKGLARRAELIIWS